MSESVGQIHLDLGLNYRNFNRELSGISRNAESMASSAFKKLGIAFGIAFATKKIIDFSSSFTRLASDLEEVQNVVDVTFGNMSHDIDNFAKNALINFGLSELSAKKFASTMGAMLKSSGLNRKQMAEMSKSLTALSGDMASFYNLDAEAAFNKIRAGISGETEPLKQLGINMSVANLEAHALSQGIKKNYKDMSQAEQVLLRYNFLMSATSDSQGDVARTSHTWANQVRFLTEQWKTFQGTLGAGFINILTPILKGINNLIQRLQVAAEYFKAFTDLVFNSKKATNSVEKSTAQAAASIGGMSDSTSDMGESAKKASKDIKNSVQGFDQLNVLAKSTADSLDDAGSGMDGGLDFETPNVELDKFEGLKKILGDIKEMVSKISNYFRDVFAPTIQGALDTIIPHINNWKLTLSQTFEEITTLGEPLKDWLANDLIPFWQVQVDAMGTIIAGLLDSSLLVFTSMRDSILPVIRTFVTEGLRVLTSFLSGCTSVFTSIFNVAKNIFDTLWNGVIDPFLKLFSRMTNDILIIIVGFWDTFGNDIIEGLNSVVVSIGEIFQLLWDAFLEPIVTTMLDTMSWMWDNHFKDLINEIAIFIGKLINAAIDIYNGFIAPIVKALIETFGPTFAEIIQTVITVLGTLITTTAGVVKGVIKSLGGILEFLSGIFTGDWKKAWSGIKTVFVGIFDSIAAVFKGVINLMIDGLNSFVRSLNKVNFDVPDWVPFMGGKSWGFNIPEIPKLAKGGLATAPTLAMVGDNKNANIDPEVITPLSKLQGMLGESNQMVVEVLLMILQALENLDFNIDLDGEKLTRIMKQKLDAENNRVGKGAISIGGVRI